MKLLFLILIFLTQGQTVRPGTIAGQVLAIDGNAVSNIRVSAMEVTDNTQATPALVGFAQTDAAGRYRIEGLAPGRYYILAGPLNSATYYPGAPDLSGAVTVALTAGATIEALNFGLSPINQSGVIQAAVLRTDTGAPIAGAQVSLRRPIVSPGQEFLAGVTDTAGQVTFGRLAPGDYNVTVQSEGYVSLSATGVAVSTGARVIVTATENEARVLFRLKPAAVVEGRVQTATGQPIPNAAVSLGQLSYRDGRRALVGASGATARTDADGRYRITVADGEYYIRVEMPPIAQRGASQNLPRVAYYPGVTDLVKASMITAKAGASPTKLDITLSVVEKGFTISGTIVNPLPGVEL